MFKNQACLPGSMYLSMQMSRSLFLQRCCADKNINKNGTF